MFSDTNFVETHKHIFEHDGKMSPTLKTAEKVNQLHGISGDNTRYVTANVIRLYIECAAVFIQWSQLA